MECIHGRTGEECSGDVHCDAPSGLNRPISERAVEGAYSKTSEADRLLQLQLRAGDSQGNLKGYRGEFLWLDESNSLNNDHVFRTSRPIRDEFQEFVRKIWLDEAKEEDRLVLNLAIFGEDKGKSLDWIRHTLAAAIHNEEGN